MFPFPEQVDQLSEFRWMQNLYSICTLNDTLYENGVKELSCHVRYCMAVCILGCFMIYPFLFYTLCQKEFI